MLLWEGLFAGFSESIGRVAVRGYARSLLANLSEVDLGVAADASTPAAVIACGATAASALFFAAVRLDRMEVA